MLFQFNRGLSPFFLYTKGRRRHSCYCSWQCWSILGLWGWIFHSRTKRFCSSYSGCRFIM